MMRVYGSVRLRDTRADIVSATVTVRYNFFIVL